MVTGDIAGGSIMNLMIIEVLCRNGILIRGYLPKSNMPNRIEQCRFAYTSYQRILTPLPYNEEIFLSGVKVLNDIVTDSCLPVNELSGKYGIFNNKN